MREEGKDKERRRQRGREGDRQSERKIEIEIPSSHSHRLLQAYSCLQSIQRFNLCESSFTT